MKKFLLILIAVFFLATFIGCSSNVTNQKNEVENIVDDQPNENLPKTSSESKFPFPKVADIKGEKGMLISTSSGDSSDGKTPIVYVAKDTMIQQIGLDLGDQEDNTQKIWDGDKDVFIYIDKVYVQAEQVGNYTQTSIDLQGDMLKPGIHTVTAVQYEDNNPNNEVFYLSEARYEVKEGH